jgi:hypothetical protein
MAMGKGGKSSRCQVSISPEATPEQKSNRTPENKDLTTFGITSPQSTIDIH